MVKLLLSASRGFRGRGQPWVAFAVGRRPRGLGRYTYGYGRPEDLAGIFVMIALSALLAGVEAIRRLVHPEPMAHAGWVLVAGVIGFRGKRAGRDLPRSGGAGSARPRRLPTGCMP